MRALNCEDVVEKALSRCPSLIKQVSPSLRDTWHIVKIALRESWLSKVRLIEKNRLFPGHADWIEPTNNDFFACISDRLKDDRNFLFDVAPYSNVFALCPWLKDDEQFVRDYNREAYSVCRSTLYHSGISDFNFNIYLRPRYRI